MGSSLRLSSAGLLKTWKKNCSNKLPPDVNQAAGPGQPKSHSLVQGLITAPEAAAESSVDASIRILHVCRVLTSEPLTMMISGLQLVDLIGCCFLWALSSCKKQLFLHFLFPVNLLLILWILHAASSFMSVTFIYSADFLFSHVCSFLVNTHFFVAALIIQRLQLWVNYLQIKLIQAKLNWTTKHCLKMGGSSVWLMICFKNPHVWGFYSFHGRLRPLNTSTDLR